VEKKTKGRNGGNLPPPNPEICSPPLKPPGKNQPFRKRSFAAEGKKKKGKKICRDRRLQQGENFPSVILLLKYSWGIARVSSRGGTLRGSWRGRELRGGKKVKVLRLGCGRREG